MRFSVGMLAWLTAGCCLVGCTPSKYRRLADDESYSILAAKTQQNSWQTPPFSIQPSPDSRNFDPYCPDQAPMPPDDAAAHHYMHCASGHAGYLHWHDRGDASSITADNWLDYLELTEEGKLPLDPDRAVGLGIKNSREYQFQLENLYLTALDLSLERFEFQLQWLGGNTTYYEFLGNQISGRGAGLESNSVTTNSGLGFSRSFTSGGQLLVDFANTFVWEFTGQNTSASMSSISMNLVQPLLRGAFRNVRMESLTQAERNVLYAARDYARYRKIFYFDIFSNEGGYLSLLRGLQAIRNLEANLERLEQSLITHEALAAAGVLAPIQVEQVFQRYQGRKLRLIRARNDLQNDLDFYKVQLGLPPELEVELDDSMLAQFELNSPELTELQRETEDLLADFRSLDAAPPAMVLVEGFEQLLSLHEALIGQFDIVLSEWEQWQASDLASGESEEDYENREDGFRSSLFERLRELRIDMADSRAEIQASVAPAADRANAWEQIQRLSRRVSGHAADLFVIQSQIRAYLIQLQPSQFDVQAAIDYALDNRLDLMNRQAIVVDAWRKVRVAENALRSNVDVNAGAVIGTVPGSNNPAKFSSDSSRFQLGVSFDAPLNRRIESNIYRTQLIEYQRSRRNWIAGRDEIVRSIRLDIRELNAEKLNFEIARQSLIAAARQVELARIELLAPKQVSNDSSKTQDALNALDNLLDAQNVMISVWANYETLRLQLLLDTEALQLNEQGLIQNDNSEQADSLTEVVTPGAE